MGDFENFNYFFSNKNLAGVTNTETNDKEPPNEWKMFANLSTYILALGVRLVRQNMQNSEH